MRYDEIVAAVQPTGMDVRGGFVVGDAGDVPPLADGRPTRSVVMIGNIARRMWPHYEAYVAAGHAAECDPLDAWTRSLLQPIAASIDADFVHPSDEPFQPFQRWAQRADDVWKSPIGLLVHADHGLWHAYRGAFLLPGEVEDLPAVGVQTSPCVTCERRPCLTACPVGAFTIDGYDAAACRSHVRSGTQPNCADDGCSARCACPVAADLRYAPDQMRFHMRAFVGAD